MLLSNAPTKVTVPFANSGTKNTIPTASQIGITAGAASYTDGFPPLTFTPLSAGGVPPAGADFNGIFNAITQAVRWQMAGGTYQYDSAFSTAVTGYPKGALLAKTNGLGLWLNQTDANTVNPDTVGTGWNDVTYGRLLRMTVYSRVSGTQNVAVDGGTPTSTGATTFTSLAATQKCLIAMVGGGGGGGGSGSQGATTYGIGAGGGGGSPAISLLTTGFSGGVTVAVGIGGPGSPAGASSGTAGGTTTFGALITCPGGTPGGSTGSVPTSGGATASNGLGGGTSTGGTILNANGQPSNPGIVLGTAIYGGTGGHSQFGAGGPAGGTNSAGGAATGAGAGGGGACTGQSGGAFAGGAGSPGIIIIYEYA